MNRSALKYDFMQIRKDPVLFASVVAPFLFWIILRFGFPAAGGLFQSLWQFDIYPYYNHVGVIFLALIPMMFGMAYGFMLLDERDEGIITALSVTPLGKSGYLKLRLGLPVLMSFAGILIFCVTLGITGNQGMLKMVFMAAILSLTGPLMVLYLGAFARNKVMGVALSKGFGILLAAIIIDYFIPGWLKWIGAYSPFFWIERAYLSLSSEQFFLYSMAALAYTILCTGWLYRLFAGRIN